MADLTLFHNPNCSTSRHALGEIEAAGAAATWWNEGVNLCTL